MRNILDQAYGPDYGRASDQDPSPFADVQLYSGKIQFRPEPLGPRLTRLPVSLLETQHIISDHHPILAAPFCAYHFVQNHEATFAVRHGTRVVRLSAWWP